MLAVDRPHDDALEGRGRARRRAAIAASIATNTAAEVGADARRRASSRPCGRSTLVATKAPSAMNSAVAEVEHVHQAEDQRQARGDDEDDHAHRQAGDGERDPGRGRADRAARRPARAPRTSSERHESKRRLRDRLGRAARRRGAGHAADVVGVHWCAASDRPSRRCCRPRPRPARPSRRGARRGRRPSPRRVSPSALAMREVLLDQQDRGLRCASARARRRSGSATIAGARPLLGSSISSSCARLDHRARDRQHLLLAARELAGRIEPELLQRREEAEEPLEPRRVELVDACAPRARRAACSRCTVRSAKMPMFSGT